MDDLNEMRKMVLGSLSEQIHKKKKNFLRYLVKVSSSCCGGHPGPALSPVSSHPLPLGPRTPTSVYHALLPSKWHLGARPFLPPQKTQYPHQEALLQKTRDSQEMLKCMDKLRDVSGQGR